jgi:hypothetical protein
VTVIAFYKKGMNRIILALCIFGILAGCSVKKSDKVNTNEAAPTKDIKAENHPDKNFILIEDFEKMNKHFVQILSK